MKKFHYDITRNVSFKVNWFVSPFRWNDQVMLSIESMVYLELIKLAEQRTNIIVVFYLFIILLILLCFLKNVLKFYVNHIDCRTKWYKNCSIIINYFKICL